MTTKYNLSGSDMDSLYIRKEFFTDNGLWLWGSNSNGELGDNTNTGARSSPIQTIAGGTNWKQMSGGRYFTAAIKTDGTLWCCGYNTFGALGDNSRTHKSSPVQTVAGGIDWKQVSCGSHCTSAIKTNGTLWSWGNNGYGQLGDNTIAHKSSPVQVVGGGTNWKQVAAGGNFTAAIKTDGTLWMWGYNAFGSLGDNTSTNKSSPVQTVAGGTNWKQVACGYAWFSAAVKTDGTLWTWGYDAYGQLGDNTIVNKSSPVQTITGGTNWKQVAVGTYHASAVKTDGTVWGWGRNNFGQVGDNTSTHKSSPIQVVGGGTNWKSVACGYNHTIVLKIS